MESHGTEWMKHVSLSLVSPATLHLGSSSCSVSGHWPVQIAVAAFLILASRCLRPSLSATSGSLLSNSENM